MYGCSFMFYWSGCPRVCVHYTKTGSGNISLKTSKLRKTWKSPLEGRLNRESTVVQNNQEYRLKYWATRSSNRLFARTAHPFACFALLASLACFAALNHSLTRSLRSLPRSRLDGYLFCVFFCSGPQCFLTSVL